jgi:hypothetical protein
MFACSSPTPDIRQSSAADTVVATPVPMDSSVDADAGDGDAGGSVDCPVVDDASYAPEYTLTCNLIVLDAASDCPGAKTDGQKLLYQSCIAIVGAVVNCAGLPPIWKLICERALKLGVKKACCDAIVVPGQGIPGYDSCWDKKDQTSCDLCCDQLFDGLPNTEPNQVWRNQCHQGCASRFSGL